MKSSGALKIDGSATTSGADIPTQATRATDPSIVPHSAVAPIHIGAYRILEKIGVGGMGVVYLAEDAHLRRRVAIKVLHPEEATNPLRKERFLRESRATAALEHDHIVRVYHADEIDGSLFLVMELLKGESLRERLTRQPRLPVEEAIRIGSEVADGLAFAHSHGLIHRDISPANVWIEPSGRVKILDFGLVHVPDESNQLTRPGSLMGTPGYMSPEQATGEKITSASDLFSLGCLLYQMAAGFPAFPGATPRERLAALLAAKPKTVRQFVPDLPLPLLELIGQMLAKEPNARPASAEIVSKELRAIDPTEETDSAAEAMAELVFDTKPTAATKNLTVRSRGAVIIGGVGIILIVFGGIFFGRFLDKDPPISANKNDPDESKRRPDSSVEKKPQPLQADWTERVSRMSPREQYAEVSKELRWRNPGIKDGEIREYDEMDGGVISFEIHSAELEDLTPLRAFPKLVNLTCDNKDGAPRSGKLASLEPLRGLPIVMLVIRNTQVADLSPLEGMKLNTLDITGTRVSELITLTKLREIKAILIDAHGIKNLETLKNVKNLQTINDMAPDAFFREHSPKN